MDNKIPKIFHYCWFGGNKKPAIVRECLKTWRKYHPDWKIVEWNENNYDVNKIPYISEAYKLGKWAFVADYTRFDILRKYGGVFPDTDVEFIRKIPDKLLQYEGFTGFELKDTVAPGLIYASIPNQFITNEIAELYEKKEHFVNGETIVSISTEVFKKYGLVGNNNTQIIKGMLILPKEYFCGFNHETQQFHISEKSISIHHYAASWVPWYSRSKIKAKIIALLVRIIGEKRYLDIKNMMWKRKKYE